jgi:hypothetical protein
MMKHTLGSLFLLLAASAALSSCEKCGNSTVSEPTPEDVEWLVYKQNDTINFITETSDTVNFTRTGIFAETIPGEGFTATDECIDQWNVQTRTVIGGEALEQPQMGTRVLSTPNELVVAISVGENGLWELDKQNPSLDSVQVNGMTYHNVFEIKPDSSGTEGVKHILFNKDYGFLSVDFYNGKQLKRQP